MFKRHLASVNRWCYSMQTKGERGNECSFYLQEEKGGEIGTNWIIKGRG